MTPDDLTGPQRNAMRVLVAAATHDYEGHREPRPCRTSNRTTLAADLHRDEMLTVQRYAAESLIAAGLARLVNEVIGTLELTDAGRQLAREAGLR